MLAEFLARPPPSGPLPCLFWLADWIALRRGVDPAGEYRSVTSAKTLLRAVRDHGGLEGLTDAQAAAAGLERTESPQEGDVGLVLVKLRRRAEAAGAICTGARWAILTPFGLAVFPAAPIAAWSV